MNNAFKSGLFGNAFVPRKNFELTFFYFTASSPTFDNFYSICKLKLFFNIKWLYHWEKTSIFPKILLWSFIASHNICRTLWFRSLFRWPFSPNVHQFLSFKLEQPDFCHLWTWLLLKSTEDVIKKISTFLCTCQGKFFFGQRCSDT